MRVRALIVAGLLALAACTSTIDATKTVVEAWRQAAQQLDLEAMTGLYAAHATLDDPHFFEPLTGRTEIRESWRELFTLPNVAIAFGDAMISANGRKATVEWVWTGEDPGTGVAYTIPGVSILVVEDGEIVRETTYYDLASSPLGRTSGG